MKIKMKTCTKQALNDLKKKIQIQDFSRVVRLRL